MEARIVRAAVLAAALLVSAGATYKTPNFVVHTQSPELAKRLGDAAEQYRKDLAIAWLGQPLPGDWSQPCMMTIEVGPNLGAGGATTFAFDQGQVFGWQMNIQGSAERLLDSVLPHEITHMIFASHFREPLPRWADEGGATSVEHAGERARHRQMLVKFLQTKRGIAFNEMFAMTEYPRDVMPLYAQGHSVVEFLIQQGGRQKYVAFLEDGLKTRRWADTVRKHYGFSDAGTFQNTWLVWVRQGCPTLVANAESSNVVPVAATGRRPRPASDLIYRPDSPTSVAQGKLVPIDKRGNQPNTAPNAWPATSAVTAAPGVQPTTLPASGWHAAGERPSGSSPYAPAVASAPAPVRTETAHPQPPENARQIILEWGNP